MKDKWVVESKLDWLHLPKNKLTFRKKGDLKDLVKETGKSVFDLEKDPEIQLHLAQSNLIEKEKYNYYQELQSAQANSDVQSKFDALVELLSRPQPVSSPDLTSVIDALSAKMSSLIDEKMGNIKKGDNEKSDDPVSSNDNDERVKEELLKEMINNSTKNIKLKNVGREQKVENEAKDFDLDI